MCVGHFTIFLENTTACSRSQDKGKECGKSGSHSTGEHTNGSLFYDGFRADIGQRAPVDIAGPGQRHFLRLAQVVAILRGDIVNDLDVEGHDLVCANVWQQRFHRDAFERNHELVVRDKRFVFDRNEVVTLGYD